MTKLLREKTFVIYWAHSQCRENFHSFVKSERKPTGFHVFNSTFLAVPYRQFVIAQRSHMWFEIVWSGLAHWGSEAKFSKTDVMYFFVNNFFSKPCATFLTCWTARIQQLWAICTSFLQKNSRNEKLKFSRETFTVYWKSVKVLLFTVCISVILAIYIAIAY